MTFRLRCLEPKQTRAAPAATATSATTATDCCFSPVCVADVAVAPAPEPSNAANHPSPPGMARCSACRHFEPRAGESPDGRCSRFATEAWSWPLFECRGYRRADPALVELWRRKAEVVARLRTDSALRYAFDVAGATPRGAALGEVSVVLGLRTKATTVTGELRIPADRWPGLALFTAYWHKAAQGRPS